MAPKTPGRPRPGGRSARVRASVLEATIAELAERGFGALSTAAVADRAGVHRTTVHRRWPDRGSLVAEALLDQAAAEIPIPDTGTLAGDLRALLGEIAATLGEPPARALLRTLVSDASASSELRAATREIWSTRFALAGAVIDRAVARGEMRGDLDPASVFPLFVGPIYLRMLVTDEPVDDAFLDQVVAIGIEGLRPR